MTIRSLAEVGARLEEAVALLPGEPADPAEIFDRYEMVAIQVLDCLTDFTPEVLEHYLMGFLDQKRMALGLPPDLPE